MSQIYLGQIVHCKVFGELELIVDGFLVVQNGKVFITTFIIYNIKLILNYFYQLKDY